jgi:F0F1-type ATP synthase epsilon subunit
VGGTCQDKKKERGPENQEVMELNIGYLEKRSSRTSMAAGNAIRHTSQQRTCMTREKNRDKKLRRRPRIDRYIWKMQSASHRQMGFLQASNGENYERNCSVSVLGVMPDSGAGSPWASM